MTGLLDTHTFIWALRLPGKLSTEVRQFIDSDTNSIAVSPASAYEICSKVALGKLPELQSLATGFEEAVADGGYELIDIDARIAIRASGLSLEHRDPFDRILAATAIEKNIVLLSKDPKMDIFGVRRIW